MLMQLFDAAIEAVSPAHCLPPALPEPVRGRTVVIGAGKGSAEMARVLEAHWPAQARDRLSGLVVTRYDHGAPCERIEVIEAAHPVPDQAGLMAAGRIRAMVSDLGSDDQVICLLSGGGSALLSEPLPGLSLADKQAVNRELLRCGANITEMNCVRKHLSAIKGGRLGLACGQARLLTLIISDIPGDDPAVTASGPTLPDPSNCADALEIIDRYQIPISESIRRMLESGDAETPKASDFEGRDHRTIILARAQDALSAAADKAIALGLAPVVLSDRLEGEARELAVALGHMCRRGLDGAAHPPFARGTVLLSGGETTVTVRGQGRGGRNAEFMLALAMALEGTDAMGLAVDTDGIDGSEDNAGCRFDPESLARMRAAGLDPRALLADNDAYSAFQAAGGLIMTGPTRTNVNDFRAIVLPAQ
ncbi:MAG: glycerate kinase [Burkholderiaceae bacterium]